MKRKTIKPLRYLKVFKAADEIQLAEKINSWINETEARVINYTIMSRDALPCILVFYETDQEE